MEFSINIKFNDYLTKNETSTITYSGSLFQNGSDSVTIVYGFGDNWSNTSEQLMEKTSDGFVAEIKILDFEKLNFCFRNSNYEWDNNDSQNYISPIFNEKPNDSFIINEDIITPILENLMEGLPSEEITLSNGNMNLENTEEIFSEITVSNSDETTLNFDIEIEDTNAENTVGDINTLPVADEKTVTENIERIQNIEKIFDELYQLETSETDSTTVEVSNIENIAIQETQENNSIENITETDDTSMEEVKAISDKQILLDDILSTQTPNETKESDFNMNSLIDEILSPIVTSSVFETESDSKTFFNESTIISENNDETLVNFENIEEADEKVDSLITNLISDLQTNIGQNTVSTNPSIFAPETSNHEENSAVNTSIVDEIRYDEPEITEESNELEINEIDIPELNIEETTTNDVNLFEETEKTVSTENNKNEEATQPSSTANEVLIAPSNTEAVEQTLNEVIEESLIDALNNDDTQKAETTNTETGLIVSPRALNKFYLFKKKVKVAVCKIFSIIPKLLSADKNENN